MGACRPQTLAFGCRTEYYTVRGFKGFQPEIEMAFRRGVNKSKSAKSFRKNVGKTKAPNVKPAPMRGGIRL